MTLSKANDTVVWELNELLAADRRAKAFTEASIAGDMTERSLGFETSHWQTLDDESNNEAEAPAEGETSSEALDEVVDGEADGEVPLEEEPIDMDGLLEARYQEGIAEGIRQCNLESQQTEALVERLVEVIAREMTALPRVWPVVTDLSLDIAKTVCLRALQTDEAFFREYLQRAFQQAELPEDIPVEIKVSEAMAAWVPGERLSEALAAQPVRVVIDSALEDGDISINYDHMTIERLLECEFDQVREQLIAQFPARPTES
ncbi:MAG: FliH/SctL family protein [Luminiphilus sp.]|nr:FliH/SctL family protein [Luminiphilus sp.]